MTARERLHTAPEESIAAYVAGSLSPAKSVVLACQASMSEEISVLLAKTELVAGALLENATGAALSNGFTEKLLAALDVAPEDAHVRDPIKLKESWTPLPLLRFMNDAGVDLKWRFAGPGVARAPLAEYENGERLYLLKAIGGTSMPPHSHRGDEWTLILKGSYHIGDEAYQAGDLHCEDETCAHQPIIDMGEECICLVAIDGKLRFHEPVLRLLQPMIGV